MPKYPEEIENIPHASDSDKDIEELLSKLKVFREDEFAKLLHECHNVIRNRDKLDPAAAFDEIAKILFVKVYIERELKTKRQRKNIFNVEYLDTLPGHDPLNLLFTDTKLFYSKDKIFEQDDHINLKPATGREVVRRLERYNLSDTSEDIKGIAFERFLGRTFRGEIGQFFTPRTITEFMIRMIEPKEGDVICDPASGSGGFLIRFFEIVRQQILASADTEYQAFKASLESKKLSDAKKAELLRTKHDEIQATLDQSEKGSRLWNLANRYIYGTDANDRMARTSKMNMIMHGDGHGGVHHHDGFINVNGIFEGRFDVVLTNPPFGANVESEDVILESEVTVPDDVFNRYKADYGQAYVEAQKRVQAAKGKPIASLFELPKYEANKIKTEILFIDRCLSLLKPSGRLGIVLPEGIFNNPSLAYVREFYEDRAFIRAVVSLPQETFLSSGASVKASLLFMQKFSMEEQEKFNELQAQTRAEIEAKYTPEIEAETKRLTTEMEILQAQKTKEASEKRNAAKKELDSYLKTMEEKVKKESRALLKERFDYPIFMYEAEKVGITATGEPDQNELFPNDNQPVDCEKTCLEEFGLFKQNRENMPDFKNRIIGLQPFPRAFQIKFSDTMRRCDPDSYCCLDWKWEEKDMASIGDVLIPRKEKVDRTKVKFDELQPMTIHFDGSVDKRDVPQGKEYSMDLFYAKPGDLVVAKIDLKNGAVGIVPDDWENVVVTNHFAIYKINREKIRPAWLHRIIQQPDFKQYLWRNKVGAEGRKEVKLDFFESIQIPIPHLKIQDSILEKKQSIILEINRLQDLLRQTEIKVDAMIHGKTKE
jgi:type I restriction enzyme M protein